MDDKELTQEQKKLATSRITICFKDTMVSDLIYSEVAGYQLLDACLVIMTQAGPIHIHPMDTVYEAIITSNKE